MPFSDMHTSGIGYSWFTSPENDLHECGIDHLSHEELYMAISKVSSNHVLPPSGFLSSFFDLMMPRRPLLLLSSDSLLSSDITDSALVLIFWRFLYDFITPQRLFLLSLPLVVEVGSEIIFIDSALLMCSSFLCDLMNARRLLLLRFDDSLYSEIADAVSKSGAEEVMIAGGREELFLRIVFSSMCCVKMDRRFKFWKECTLVSSLWNGVMGEFGGRGALRYMLVLLPRSDSSPFKSSA